MVEVHDSFGQRLDRLPDISDGAADSRSANFSSWTTYFGELSRAEDESTEGIVESYLYGFENASDPSRTFASVSGGGGTYGLVCSGEVHLWDEQFDAQRVGPQQWFACPEGCEMHLGPQTRVMLAKRLRYKPMRVVGGAVETRGRLRYIDRCSDSVLVHPARRGDPCLNHLHFPEGVEQTEHTHPSVRFGVVIRGRGQCQTPDGLVPLVPGQIFAIPTGGLHRFITSYRTMDVIAFHPDSDFGPTDDDHPMVNRTWVDGAKIDNSRGVHLSALLEGSGPATQTVER